MTETTFKRYISGVQDELEQVRQWLLRPCAASLEACPSTLARAVGYLHDLSGQIDPLSLDPHLLNLLLELSREIHATRTLLDAATAIHLRRVQRMA